MSHVTYENESCVHICDIYVHREAESHDTHERVTSHMHLSHCYIYVIYMYIERLIESRHSQMSHVTHMNESCVHICDIYVHREAD